MAKTKAAPAKGKAVKAAASGHSKGAVKQSAAIKPQASKAVAGKVSSSKAATATPSKKANAPAVTMKKPTTTVKTNPTASAPKAHTASKVTAAPKAAVATLAKPALSKVEMPHVAAKNADAAKALAGKSKAPVKAVVKAAPAAIKIAPAAVKPVAVVAKPVAPANPAVMAKPVAVASSAPTAVPQPMLVKQPAVHGARPTAQTSFGRPMQPKAPAVAPVAAAAVVAKPPVAAAVAANEPKKPVASRHGFKTNEWIVYPAQGVGRIVAIEEQEIAGMTLELFVITFEKDKMTLRVPTGKAQTVGMRKLAEDGVVKRAMDTLRGKARIKRTMWSRRAQEFEAKINSGDLVSVAEVVRDLFRAENQPEQSYSERQLYERALDRMAREIAAVDKLDERGAAQKIVEVLSKSAKGRRAAADEAAANASAAGDEAVEAA
jgi:CarD family transcriptional regulator